MKSEKQNNADFYKRVSLAQINARKIIINSNNHRLLNCETSNWETPFLNKYRPELKNSTKNDL